MNLLQSLAGQASVAMERLTATLAPKAEPQVHAGSGQDFAATLALAMNPEAAAKLAVAMNPEAAAALPLGATHDAAATEQTPEGDGAALPGAMAGLPALEGAKGAEGAEAIEPSALEEVDAATLTALAGAPDPSMVQRNLDLLDPEFESRLKRVIQRMESEFGHKVEITETFRTQERQNFLYEQGRSRPGQVVTWTRASNHTLGRAADVLIDGTYDNQRGYARLAEIASEEGLRTLGPRDPGHVELPGAGRGKAVAPKLATLLEGKVADTQPKWEPTLEVDPQPGRHLGVARVAEVARVADVAQVAQVASVARVAHVVNPAAPGLQGATVLSAQSSTRRETTVSRTNDAVQVLHEAMGNHQGIAALRSELGRAFGGDSAGSGEKNDDPSQESNLFRTEGSLMSRGTFQSAVNEVLATSNISGAERAARILELQDGAAVGPMSHVTLRLDNPSGGEDRIRIDLRGSSVDARIDMSNVGEAERVTARLGELRTTLERHGLEAESLRVRTTASVNQTDAVEMPRLGVAVSESEASRGGSRFGSGNSESSREEWKESTQGQPRRDPSDPRHRPRRPTPEKETA